MCQYLILAGNQRICSKNIDLSCLSTLEQYILSSFLGICSIVGSFLLFCSDVFNQNHSALFPNNTNSQRKYSNGFQKKLFFFFQVSPEKMSKCYLKSYLEWKKKNPGPFLRKIPFLSHTICTAYTFSVTQESLLSGHDFTHWLSASLSAIGRITATCAPNTRQLFRRGERMLVFNRWTEDIKLMNCQKPVIIFLD